MKAEEHKLKAIYVYPPHNKNENETFYKNIDNIKSYFGRAHTSKAIRDLIDWFAHHEL